MLLWFIGGSGLFFFFGGDEEEASPPCFGPPRDDDGPPPRSFELKGPFFFPFEGHYDDPVPPSGQKSVLLLSRRKSTIGCTFFFSFPPKI